MQLTKKKERIITVISVAICSLVISYFEFGLIGAAYVDHTLINVRGSTIEKLDRIDHRAEKTQRDYPILQERKVVTFPYSKETLTGYLYECDNPHGVIISAHGANSLADATTAQYQQYYLSLGWDVFSFDQVGCGRSTGKGMESLYASRYCVGAAINKVKSMEETKNLPICLMGHSWGAFGVLSASGDYPNDVKAVASFAGFDTAQKVMVELAYTYASPALKVTEGSINFGYSCFHGNGFYYSSSKVVKKNTNINYVIVQGDKDDVVTLKASAYKPLYGLKLNHVDLVLLKDQGHYSPWKSYESEQYMKKVVEPKVKELKKKYNGDIPESEIDNLVSSIDFEKTSILNYELLDHINEIFLKSII